MLKIPFHSVDKKSIIFWWITLKIWRKIMWTKDLLYDFLFHVAAVISNDDVVSRLGELSKHWKIYNHCDYVGHIVHMIVRISLAWVVLKIWPFSFPVHVYIILHVFITSKCFCVFKPCTPCNCMQLLVQLKLFQEILPKHFRLSSESIAFCCQ